VPLAFLYEQKRKIKIDINKKKKSTGLQKLGKGISKLGAISKFGTFAKPSISKPLEDVKQQYQTNLEQIDFGTYNAAPLSNEEKLPAVNVNDF
jgi:hypothetical protein